MGNSPQPAGDDAGTSQDLIHGNLKYPQVCEEQNSWVGVALLGLPPIYERVAE